ncbi:MAG TPA: aldehyde dehydrogenase family protein, partial [Myxococcus sp.]|nr:aldehyde dehydrogenase family protein [Myxococcus sp.]
MGNPLPPARAFFIPPPRSARGRASGRATEAEALLVGKPLDEALAEVDFAAGIYAYYAEHAERFLADEPVELLDGQGTAVVRRSPFGPLLGIMPWNFPSYQVARFAAPNLVAGNPVLLKHA